MNAPANSAAPARLETPLPSRQFKWFMLFWHVFLLGGLVAMLAMSIGNGRTTGWKAVMLAVLVVIQSGLYLWTFGQQKHWPWPWWWIAFYFGSSIGIWMIEVRLDPIFDWVVWAYWGQMLGAMPPKISLPGSGVILVLYSYYRIGWENLFKMSGPFAFAMGATVISWIVLGLFLHRLTVTSTERARLIHELEAAQRELEQTRERDAELAVLRERERLARDLHDSLGHTLVTLTVQLEAIQRLFPVDPARAHAQVEDMKVLTRMSMESLRRTLANLRAAGLEDRPLAEALKALCAEVSTRAGLSVDCHLAPEAESLKPAVAEVLWRVAQEALANIEKHAQARQVKLQLRSEPQAIVLRVTDDGVGLPENAEAQPGHYGLRGMRERIEGLGGALTLGKAEPHGCVVEARIPVVG